MDIESKEKEMGLFTKSEIGQKRDAASKAHSAWHTASLLSGRRRGLLDDSQGKLDAARAIVAAGEAEPSDEITGEFRDLSAERAEVTRLEDAVSRRQRELEAADESLSILKNAKDAAERALRGEEHKALIRDVLKALRTLHAADKAAGELEGDGVPSLRLGVTSDEMLANYELMVERYVNPAPRKEIDPMCAIRCLRDISRVDGPMDGRGYQAGEGCAFPAETAARLVALGAAEYLIPNSQNAAAAEKARKQLAAIDRTEGSTRVSVGWTSPDAA